MEKKKAIYKWYIIISIIFVVMVNILAWLCPAFCDWYTLYITPIIVNVFGRLTNLFPFSVGEIMILLGLLIVLAAIVIAILLVFLRKKQGYIRFAKVFYKSFAGIVVGVCIVMTTNCVIFYHCTPIDGNPDVDYREYTVEELEILRNYIVNQCNYYMELMPRDENGDVIYTGDMQAETKKALHGIA
ncbi:MAG: DUF3810 family protein, partial [Lachnospiraceae bacterium]|nr:DUF3810 family protein [Lachnospiraceae bacterium]